MYNPMPGRLLPDPLLHEGLLGAKQLHGELVVRGSENVLQLVPHPAGLCLARDGAAVAVSIKSDSQFAI